MILLAEKDKCTGCGACEFICPKKSITMQLDIMGVLYPVINVETCIECSKCQKICPIINSVNTFSPKKAYASWSLDQLERDTSASGGIASEAYRYALSKDYIIGGAVIEKDYSVPLVLSEKKDSIILFKNSKYVFSEIYNLYSQIKSALLNNRKCLVICLPCQAAALRSVFAENPRLLLIDLVCHGCTPLDYLRQHINILENLYNQKVARISFRDPNKDTTTFSFSLYNAKDECFYSKPAEGGRDSYNFAYHKAISYRENCYQCSFASAKRVSDITLSDYKGLGKFAPCSYRNLKVSSVLINTEIGHSFFKQLLATNKIYAEERPIAEPIAGDPQLQHPSLKTTYRQVFVKRMMYSKGDFEYAIKPIISSYFRTVTIRKIISLPKRFLKKIIRFFLK